VGCFAVSLTFKWISSRASAVGSRLGPAGCRNDCKVRAPIQSLAISDCNLCAVVDVVVRRRPSFFNQFQLVHFTCSYAPRKWLPVLREKLPCVTSHHRVSDWELMKHSADDDVVVVASRNRRRTLCFGECLAIRLFDYLMASIVRHLSL